MQVTRRFLTLFVVLCLTTVCSLQGAHRELSHHQAPHAQPSNASGEAMYEAVLRRVLPSRLEPSQLPREIRWMTVVLVRDAFHTSEYWFSLSRGFDGAVTVVVRIPHGGSLARQIRDITKKSAATAAEEISKEVKIDECQTSDKTIPRLRQLGTNYEDMRLSPVMPVELYADPFEYLIWSQSQYGQEMTARLSGFGPGNPRQPHPLVDWVEEERSTTAKVCQGVWASRPSP